MKDNKSNFYRINLIAMILAFLTLITPIFWNKLGPFYYFIFGFFLDFAGDTFFVYNPNYPILNISATVISSVILGSVILLIITLFSKRMPNKVKIYLSLLSGVLIIISISIYLVNIINSFMLYGINFFEVFQFNFLGLVAGIIPLIGSLIEFFTRWNGDESQKEQILLSLQHREKFYQNIKRMGIFVTILGIISVFGTILALNNPIIIALVSIYPIFLFISFIPELALIIPGIIFIFLKQIIITHKLRKLKKTNQ